MTRESLSEIFAEYERSGRRGRDPELEAVRIAILTEDLLDIVLSDAELDPQELCRPGALDRLAERRQGARG
jgi:hypothetical protein